MHHKYLIDEWKANNTRQHKLVISIGKVFVKQILLRNSSRP